MVGPFLCLSVELWALRMQAKGHKCYGKLKLYVAAKVRREGVGGGGISKLRQTYDEKERATQNSTYF